MKRSPRRPDEPILSGFLVWRIVFVSTVLVLGVHGVFVWLEGTGADIEIARTASANTLVMFEVFYVFSVRKLQTSPLTGLFTREARLAWAAVSVVVLLQLLFTYAPFMNWPFHSRPLSVEIWGVSIAVGVTIFFLVEVEKLVIRVLSKAQRRHHDTNN